MTDRELMQQALKALEEATTPLAKDRQEVLQAQSALRERLSIPVFTPCNCRWNGETQVQQCTLHAAHIEAIHEWAERAKTAEAKLKQEPDAYLHDDGYWTAAKTYAGRQLNDRLLFAGSPKIGVYTTPRAQPATEDSSAVQPAPGQEPVAGKGKELSERLKLCARNVAFVAAGRVDMSSAAMQEMFALIDHVCAGLDSPPAAPVQEPVSVILSQWKSGAIGATEAILELFKHYSSNPSISATQQTAQQAVPEGYALIGIDALKAWGKYDLVKSMCMFPVDPPEVHRQQKPAAEITGVDECGPTLGWYRHWINFPVGTKLYTTPPAQEIVCSTGLCHYRKPQQEPVGVEGAIVNGRVYADRLEHYYRFECEAGPLNLCNDWVEFRRCFEWLAEHTTPTAAQPEPVQEPVFCEYCGGNDEDPQDHCMDCTRPQPAAPVQSLPFGVGGGLVAIKTLLSRDPCAHATVAIQMIDAILAEHSPQKANTP